MTVVVVVVDLIYHWYVIYFSILFYMHTLKRELERMMMILIVVVAIAIVGFELMQQMIIKVPSSQK
jgi:hypothetical protein